MKKWLIVFSLLFVFLFAVSINTAYAADSDVPWLETNKVSCGNVTNIPEKAPQIVSTVILIGQTLVPILLVFFGILDLAKGVMSQKEDEIKKGQQTFIKRLIMGALVFFIIALVKLLIGIVGDSDSNKKNIISCIDCFVNGVENCGGGGSDETPGGGGTTGLERNPAVNRNPALQQVQ